MIDIPKEELLKMIPSNYKLVIVASRRAFDINEGAPRLVSMKLEKSSQVALEEIREGKITYKEKETK